MYRDHEELSTSTKVVTTMAIILTCILVIRHIVGKYPVTAGGVPIENLNLLRTMEFDTEWLLGLIVILLFVILFKRK